MTRNACEFHDSDEACVHCLGADCDRYREALQRIADEQCDCSAYYRCNGCPSRIAAIAQEALDG